MFTYRTDSPYPTLPRVRVVVEPLPADDHTSPSQVTATTLPLKEWAEDWYPIPSPLPAVSGERPDRTPKPLPVTTRTQLLGQIQQQAEAWCAVAQALDTHFPKWNPWCGRSATENAVLCIKEAATSLSGASEKVENQGDDDLQARYDTLYAQYMKALAKLSTVGADLAFSQGRERGLSEACEVQKAEIARLQSELAGVRGRMEAAEKVCEALTRSRYWTDRDIVDAHDAWLSPRPLAPAEVSRGV